MTKWQCAVDQLVKESGVTVRAWRKTNSGVAYCGSKDWGVEIPIPKGPVTFITAAHEIGHQLLHRTGRKPRWIEEVEAWEYALRQLQRFDLPGYDRALKSATQAISYSFAKAHRRGVSHAKIESRYPEWVDLIWRYNVEKRLYEIYPGKETSTTQHAKI